MSKAFLPTILEQKKRSGANGHGRPPALRQTYRLYDFLKSNQEQSCKIIAEVKKPVLVWGILTWMWILSPGQDL